MVEAIYQTLNALMLVSCVACLVLWWRAFVDYRKRRLADADDQSVTSPTNEEGQDGSSIDSLQAQEETTNPYQAPSVVAEDVQVEHERPFWSLVDGILMYGLMVFLSTVLVTVVIGLGWVERPAPYSGITLTKIAPMTAIAVSSLGGILAALLTIAWLHLFAKNPLAKLGLLPSRAYVRLGLRASLMLLPPVLLVSAAVSQFVPYEHPILDVLANMTSITEYLLLIAATAIVTPFVEEFLFRVLLQGGLQSWADRNSFVAGRWQPTAWWPMLVVSGVFAMMHFGQGAAPIPLFLLSVGLGYLYRKTGNITAPMVVHMVLNGLTLLVELFKPVT